MFCTVVSLGVILVSVFIPGVTTANGYGFLFVLVGIILYAGIACWIAYGVVWLVATYRLKSLE